jgi:BlaI family penicillinase repressor
MKIVLADREAELMEVLWEHGPVTVTEVRQRLKDDLAYTTVLTILRNLEAKGYVGHDGAGRAHLFSARVDRSAAQRSAVRDLAAKLFKGSSALLLTQLVSDETLTDEDVQRIRRLLNQRSKGSKS